MPHDHEARGIDERGDPLIVARKPGSRLALDRIVHVHDGLPDGHEPQVSWPWGASEPVRA